MGIKILVIEDNTVWSSIISSTLLEEGFHVSIANSYENALSKLEADTFDFITLDLNLTDKSDGLDLDGFEIMKKIQSSPVKEYPQIIVISAYSIGNGPNNPLLKYNEGVLVMGKMNFEKNELISLINSFSKTNSINKSIYSNKKRVIKIFLASSSELVADRKDFEIFINRKNKELNLENIFIELTIWEDFIDAISKTRLQDEYNKKIKECDVFVSLYFTKVGKFTKEEFNIAHQEFLVSGRPLIYTYFKNAPIMSNDINERDFTSKIKFFKYLKQIGHFPNYYNDINDLNFHFTNQFQKIKAKLLDTKS